MRVYNVYKGGGVPSASVPALLVAGAHELPDANDAGFREKCGSHTSAGATKQTQSDNKMYRDDLRYLR